MVTTKGGDFNNFRAKHDVRQTETAANKTAIAEQLAHLVRRRIGCDVKIFRFFAEQKVTDATADQPGFISRFIQPVHYLQGIFTDIFA